MRGESRDKANKLNVGTVVHAEHAGVLDGIRVKRSAGLRVGERCIHSNIRY